MALESFVVRGYRALRNLIIPTLGRVNLIVGKNGAGKTSLLEAVRIYASQGTPPVLLDILESRDEKMMKDPGPADFGLYSEATAFFNLFAGRPFSTEARTIEIGPAESSKLTISFEWLESGESRQPSLFWGETRERLVAERPVLTVKAQGDILSRILLDTGDSLETLKRRGVLMRSESTGIPCTFVASSRLGSRELSEWWDAVALSDLESLVLSTLKIIEPGIEKISFVARKEYPRVRVPIVRLADSADPVPLKSLGGGISRMLETSLALVNAKNGFLLIDEIENGVHYTAQSELWRMIIEATRLLNVQVFATTHSWDLVAAFQDALNGSGYGDGFLIRLDQMGPGEVVATMFDPDELRIATRERIEVR